MIPPGQARQYACYLLLSLPLAYVLSASYVGLNGSHVWRQADVYAHILGFAGVKDFVPFEDFLGQRSVYDIPAYEYLIAKIAVLFRADALVVTRYVNALLWLLTALAGWRIAERLERHSGIIFLFLISTSPLLLHYFSVPMPDAMALACSLLALSLLLEPKLGGARRALACGLLAVAALIKSPVPFVVLVFYTTYLGVGALLGRESAVQSLREHWRYVTGPLLVALFCAVFAELLRNRILGQEILRFAQDPGWYFGTLELRTSPVLWATMLERFVDASTRYFGYPYIALLLVAIHPAFRLDRVAILAAVIAFLSGWLAFPQLYSVHDYYQLPGTVIVYLVVAMAARGVWVFLTGRLPLPAAARIRGLEYEHALLIGLAGAALLSTAAMSGLGEPTRTSIYDALEQALRNERRFLYVNDDVKFKDNIGPGIGGLAVARFRKMNLQKLELDCDRWVEEFRAVLVHGSSPCLTRHRHRGVYYFQDGDYQFLLIEPQVQQGVTRRDAPP
jgi:hypothetical protein